MDRKEIVKALGEHFGVKPEYLGVPSFAYQIETEGETYTIDRAGNITNAEGIELELETILKPAVQEDANEVTEEQIEEINIEEQTEEIQNEPFEIAITMEGHTGITLRNLINMIYSKQELIIKSLAISEDIINEDFVKGINEVKIQTLEEFKREVDNIGKENCKGIEFDFDNKKISFEFINEEADEKIKAYTQFIELLDKSAKELKHASAKVSVTDNPKFTFRVFLIRLGMVGDEYKTARKILLKNLDGNAAFRYGKPEKNIEE